MHTLGNLAQEGRCNLLIGREFLEVDRDKKLLSLLINITDIDTTLMGEKDPIALRGIVSKRIGMWRRAEVSRDLAMQVWKARNAGPKSCENGRAYGKGADASQKWVATCFPSPGRPFNKTRQGARVF